MEAELGFAGAGFYMGDGFPTVATAVVVVREDIGILKRALCGRGTIWNISINVNMTF